MGVNVTVMLKGEAAHFELGVVEKAVSVLLAPEATTTDVQRVVHIMREAEEKDRDALAAQIKREAPKFGRLADLLPEKTSDRIALIGVILLAAQVIVQLLQGGEKPADITINQVVNQITVQHPAP